MRTTTRLIIAALALALLLGILASSQPATAKGPKNCTTIQQGTLTDSAGNPISVGYDDWGYNYQAHRFNGWYDNSSRPTPPVTTDDVWLQMQWNDAWLSNKDCDGDSKLDRHYGHDSYIGSGAWLTNHMRGTNDDGSTWTYFVKIVAVPADATSDAGVWYAADGTEIGPVIWGSFAIVQEVESGVGATYVSPSGPGLGKW